MLRIARIAQSSTRIFIRPSMLNARTFTTAVEGQESEALVMK